MTNSPIAHNRTFDATRQAHGFRSQAHLDAFLALHDHTTSCKECAARDGYVVLDDGIQPTSGRCPAAQQLDAAVSVGLREAKRWVDETIAALKQPGAEAWP